MGRLREAFSVDPENKEKIKTGIWGAVAGAIIAMIIGFNWGGWETAGATQKLNEEAVLQNNAEICVAQTVNALSKDGLAQLQKLDSWDRSQGIEKSGWDKMPGQNKADYGVSQACSEKLHALVAMK